MPDEPLEPELEPELPLVDPELLPLVSEEELFFFVPVAPVAPFDITSIWVTWSVSPDPEKLART